MTRHATTLIGFVLVAMAAKAVVARQDPVFRASADLVSVGVSARRGGRPVAGLTASDFELRDNGVPQAIADMSYEKLPIDVTMALDVSESVSGAVLNRLRRSVQQLKTDLGAGDRLKLMTFNMRVKRAMDFTEPAAATDAVFDRVAGFGSTAIFDTIAVALVTAAPPDRRQLVVLFSDGRDNSSITDQGTLIDVAQRTTATLGVVLAVGPRIIERTDTMGPRIMDQPPLSSPGIDPAIGAIYAQLAKETGGVVVPAGGDLAATFTHVLDEFRSSYVLHFTPRGVDRGGIHALDVRVKRSGIDVRARKSYAWH